MMVSTGMSAIATFRLHRISNYYTFGLVCGSIKTSPVIHRSLVFYLVTQNKDTVSLGRILYGDFGPEIVNRTNRMGETPLHVAERNYYAAKSTKEKKKARLMIMILQQNVAELLPNSRGEIPNIGQLPEFHQH